MSFLLGILLSATTIVSCYKSEVEPTPNNTTIATEVSNPSDDASTALALTGTQTAAVGQYKKTVVSTESALASALNAAAPNDTVYVADNAKINITSTKSLRPGVKLYSGRGKNASLGGLVYTTNLGLTMFKTTGSCVRVSGLRIQGPSTTTAAVTINYSNIGILVNQENVLIDNVEVFGFPYAGIKVQNTKTGHITKSYIHHNQRSGLGYGIVLDKGFALIDYNFFDYNRHAIVGGGASGTSYEAAFNTVMPHATEHSFDMHGSLGDYKGVGGTSINIHDNTFYMGQYRAITVRATPEKELIIKNNKFIHTSESSAILLFSSGTWGTKTISGNTYKIPRVST